MLVETLESRLFFSPTPLPWMVAAVMRQGDHFGGVTNMVAQAPASGVVGVHLAYLDSVWDATKGVVTAADASTIAIDKIPLLPGQTATAANWSSYTRGINGIFLDLVGSAALGVSDFDFRAGNDSTPETTWTTAQPPAINNFLGGGVNGSNRIALSWTVGSIVGQWLQVTVAADANTGLSAPYVFYFGSMPGDATGDGQVTSSDESAARVHPSTWLHPAAITSAYDFNRDGLVNSNDEYFARSHQTTAATALVMITAPATVPPPPIPGNWHVAFDDEFNGTTLGPNFVAQTWWGQSVGQGIETNNPANASVANGNLQLTATKTANGYDGVIVTSGGLPGNTANSVSFLYGYVEARIEIPQGGSTAIGGWPAWWLLPESSITTGFNHDGSGEIDIMDDGTGDPSVLHAGVIVHGQIYQHQNPGNLSARYHTFAADWQPDHITWYMDGQQWASTTNAALIPTEAMYVLANLAVGNDWATSPPPASTPFPQVMLVDWIRIWQKG